MLKKRPVPDKLAHVFTNAVTARPVTHAVTVEPLYG